MAVRKCRIFPESRRGLFFVVYLWPTKRAMLEHCRAEGLHAHPRTAAQCSTYTRERIHPDGRRRVSPQLGEINFHRGRVTTEILSHEIAHAAQGWARRIGLDPTRPGTPDRRCAQGLVSDDEERYCYALGRMVSLLNNRFHDWGAYDGR